MRTMEKCYESLCRLMNDGRVIRSRTADFSSLCRSVGADETGLSNMLYREFGMSGDEILEAFRTGHVKK